MAVVLEDGRVIKVPQDLRCNKCLCKIEVWWNYCADCGYHIAANEPVFTGEQSANSKEG